MLLNGEAYEPDGFQKTIRSVDGMRADSESRAPLRAALSNGTRLASLASAIFSHDGALRAPDLMMRIAAILNRPDAQRAISPAKLRRATRT